MLQLGQIHHFLRAEGTISEAEGLYLVLLVLQLTDDSNEPRAVRANGDPYTQLPLERLADLDDTFRVEGTEVHRVVAPVVQHVEGLELTTRRARPEGRPDLVEVVARGALVEPDVFAIPAIVDVVVFATIDPLEPAGAYMLKVSDSQGDPGPPGDGSRADLYCYRRPRRGSSDLLGRSRLPATLTGAKDQRLPDGPARKRRKWHS